ncbi:MAG: hypothetical protein BIFFINMI_03927 [Phycisphaerae bacterium]|nr:hypothetical protein [Phycisphaerae bacterium]
MSTIASILVFLGLLGLTAWAVGAWWLGRRRRRQLRDLARDRNLRFVAGDPFDLPDQFFHVSLFTRGHSRLASNIVHGHLGPLAVRLCDYQYETGTGKTRRTHRWQAALVQTETRFPGLICQPRSCHDPLEAIFGFDDVRFDADPFAGIFHVWGEDAQFAYRLLHAKMTDTLSAHPHVTFETQGQTVAVYCEGLLEPAEAIELVLLACDLLGLAPEQLRRDLRLEAAPPSRP